MRFSTTDRVLRSVLVVISIFGCLPSCHCFSPALHPALSARLSVHSAANSPFVCAVKVPRCLPKLNLQRPYKANLMMTSDASSGGKSVLVVSWFYAEPKQLELVERIYKKKGFTDIVIQESPVKQTSTPRGWYKHFIRCMKKEFPLPESGVTLGRHFDVVHCMSGGFLNFYLLLASKIPIQFDKLVMDSTPILPQPKSFVRFARAYMNDNGLAWMPTIIPEKLHTAYQTARWSIGASYVRYKHKFVIREELSALEPAAFEAADTWTKWASKNSALNRYDNIVEDSIETVFNRPGLHTTFMYNPNDQYINPADIKYIAQKCKEFGGEVTEVLTETKHIETIFRKPNILFNAISAMEKK